MLSAFVQIPVAVITVPDAHTTLIWSSLNQTLSREDHNSPLCLLLEYLHTAFFILLNTLPSGYGVGKSEWTAFSLCSKTARLESHVF